MGQGWLKARHSRHVQKCEAIVTSTVSKQAAIKQPDITAIGNANSMAQAAEGMQCLSDPLGGRCVQRAVPQPLLHVVVHEGAGLLREGARAAAGPQSAVLQARQRVCVVSRCVVLLLPLLLLSSMSAQSRKQEENIAS